MRFTSDGPDIPDELLIARDAGNVLFFCGAGVSKGEAGLPDFATLAEEVLTRLGSSTDSPARRLFYKAREFEKNSGITGLVPTDQIFGLLEQEFEAAEVREAVAMALAPKPGYSLGAHRTLLDLSRTRGGTPRLVTTNFDLLFEECEVEVGSFNPPHLPDPNRDGDFRGIIHLHGRVDGSYRKACDDEFVLSSADFGHAYLSDGWATRYIQDLLRKFKIVFVGYSADDPPVRYLLEALNRFGRSGNGLYAFQSGDTQRATAQWSHKGVSPISYTAANNYAELWRTLSAWAERARDPDGWHHTVIADAVRGPAAMAPHERGMLKHLASTTYGATVLATSETIIPAQWLLVFDRCARYDTPRPHLGYEKGASSDPFDAFGLDSDTPPPSADPDNALSKRKIPEDAWDAFLVTEDDRKLLSIGEVAHLRAGRIATALPTRLRHLGHWIAKVASQPETLWWAAGQSSLHQDVQSFIENSLRQQWNQYACAIREGWALLLQAWRQEPPKPSYEKYTIEGMAKTSGWTPGLVRAAMSLYRPILKVVPSSRSSPPTAGAELTLDEIVHASIKYPRPDESFDLPTEYLPQAARLLRRYVMDGVELEHEIRENCVIYLDTLYADDGGAADEDSYGLTGHLVVYTKIVLRMALESPVDARAEIEQWTRDDAVSTRIRVWSAGHRNIADGEQAGQIFESLSNDEFWNHHLERDLLFALRERWDDLPPAYIAVIEERLLHGSIPIADDFENRQNIEAHYRLSRLHWLAKAGVKYSFDYEVETAVLRSLAPDWTEAASTHVARPMVSGVTTIQANTAKEILESLPPQDILEVANNASRNDYERLVLRQPFRGLVTEKPRRAIRAIIAAARNGKFYAWAWDLVLSSDEKQLTSRCIPVLARHLTRLSTSQLRELRYSASAWLRQHGTRLSTLAPGVFDALWTSLLEAIQDAGVQEKTPGTDGSCRWVDRSINNPVGHIAEALFTHVEIDNIDPSRGLTDRLKTYLEDLLNLEEDAKNYAIVIVASRLNWLYHVDASWTEKNLFPAAQHPCDTVGPFWSGYLWRAAVPQPKLYLHLKSALAALSRQSMLRRDHARALGGMHLSIWANDMYTTIDGPSLSDGEFREILIQTSDELRSEVLLQFQRWASPSDSKLRRRVTQFFTDVWPRQRVARTSQNSARLADLAFSIPDMFPELVPLILPRLVPVQIHSTRLSYSELAPSIVRNHPKELLDVLWAILDVDATNWPYKARDVLQVLAEQDVVREDSRLEELRRRALRR